MVNTISLEDRQCLLDIGKGLSFEIYLGATWRWFLRISRPRRPTVTRIAVHLRETILNAFSLIFEY
jgi:hypothetical protein